MFARFRGRSADQPAQSSGATSRRPSARTLSRIQRERAQRRSFFTAVGIAGLLVLLVVLFGIYREFFQFPGQPIAKVYAETVTLRTYTDDLAEQMRQLQNQAAGLQNDPNAAGSRIQQLIDAQESLPEDILEVEIERALIRHEAKVRNVTVSDAEINAKINEFLSIQRDFLNRPTSTATPTATLTPTLTETPEGFAPTPTNTRTPSLTPTPLDAPTATPTPLDAPTVTPTASATVDPNATATPTSTPRPTRTPLITPTAPPTLEPGDFEQLYRDLASVLRSETNYRRDVEYQLLRQKLRNAVGAAVPAFGPRAQVRRIVTSTIDEARVGLLSLRGGFSTFEELVDQTADRRIEDRDIGDLGFVARGAEMREFDEVVFSPDTPLGEWIEPFAAGYHFELAQVLTRDEGPYDAKNVEKMKDRLFADWLAAAKASPEVIRDLSAQERAWAVDRASRGIFVTETPRR